MKKIIVSLLSVFLLLFATQFEAFAQETKVVNFGVANTYPKYGQEGVPVDTEISIDFTRQIAMGTGEIFLLGKGKEWQFNTSINGSQLTIVPKEPLSKGGSYQVVIMNGAIANAENDNSPNGMGEKFVLSFSTPYIDLSQTPQTNIQPQATAQPAQPQTAQPQVTTAQAVPTTKQLLNLQLAPETALPPAQTYTLHKNLPMAYKLSAGNTNYALWTSNPQLVNAQVFGDILVINGINAGTAQVAVKNLADNTKIVLNVVVQ